MARPLLSSKLLHWLGEPRDHLDEQESAVLEHVERGGVLTTKELHDQLEPLPFGAWLADQVAAFGGSWRFIMIFGGVLAGWTVLNTELLGATAFDPYPYVFLNLLLSMLAALQAPIIMMSQNRQAARDRQAAENDYAVNLRAEIEIMALHEKFDALRGEQILEVLRQQQAQIDRLEQLLLEQRGTR